MSTSGLEYESLKVQKILVNKKQTRRWLMV